MKTKEILRQYYRDDPNYNILQSESFKFKINITGKTPESDNKWKVKTTMPLKYLGNFLRVTEMPLISSEISIVFASFENCVIPSATWKTNLQ